MPRAWRGDFARKGTAGGPLGQFVCRVHAGGQAWNEHRQRFVRTVQQLGGESSLLGEIWYAESDTPMGPWVYARKVITHDDYTFYNPWIHPHFDRAGGRRMYFEATYTKTFAGDRFPLTPRYNYNQIMYALDLEAPRLVLPVPVYDLAAAAASDLAVKQRVPRGTPPLAPAFFAPDRAAPGTLPVFWSDAACAPRQLQIAAEPSTPPAFYALSPDAAARPAHLVALWAYADAAGNHAYSVHSDLALPGFTRLADPLAYVWPSRSA